MPYLVDGHNLIPKIPGLTLQALDDEIELIRLLSEFCRLQRKQVEVFFDNAPPGQANVRVLGSVTARFVRQGASADQAILTRLKALGRVAPNWTVVSSDQAVQAAARQARAHSLSSEAFARLMSQAFRKTGAASGKGADQALSAEEVEGWLELFRTRKGK